ncbi:venom allergen 5 [Drosophila grimshawi]|uniref:venom allergen 5 n=1 Tax=Drosophila grimshawi TaxID=7222 RepID=UPI0013EF010D|nr:venom allergen 5 [Drosophila grimshawi]
MDTHLAVALSFVQLNIIVTFGEPFLKLPQYGTKIPKYVMRGHLHIPKQPENYCRKELCPLGITHVACGHQFWGDNCPKPRDGVNMERNKNIIITHHNNLRMRMHRALGHLPPAKRLLPLRWDEELAVIAMRVTNFCNDEEYSACVNTARYLNVAKSSEVLHYKDPLDVPEVLKHVIQRNWGQFSTFKKESVEKFPKNATPADYKFANMIYQKNDVLGCGMLVRGKIHMVYFTCLYNHKMQPGERLYDIKN